MSGYRLASSDFTDSNLLFAVIALQRGFLDQGKFVDACAVWALRRNTPLPEILIERQWINSTDKVQIELDVERLLQKHQGDVRASIQELADDQIRHSLARVFDDSSLSQLTTGDVRVPHHPETPRTRDRYVVIGEAKKGGIGLVWRAKDIELGREVALKELRKDRLLSAELRERFLAEAQINAQLTHPNIVPAFDLIHPLDGESPFYTMQYVEGRTLTDATRQFHARHKKGKAGVLELRELLSAFVAICKAVDYAHDRGVLHRDLKGLNVILGDHGEVFLLDWGMAKVVGRTEHARADSLVELATMSPDGETREGALLGTPAYMAPEQAAGRLDQIDRRTDVYGLGVILFEILTGRLPFEVDETPSLLEDLPKRAADRRRELDRRRTERLLDRVQHEPAPSPRRFAADVALPLEKICLKAMAKRKDDRYSTARELAREIERWLGDEPVHACPESWMTKAGRWGRRHKSVVAAGFALLATAVPFLIILFVLSEGAREDLRVEQEKTKGALTQAVINEKEAIQRRLDAEKLTKENIRLAQVADDRRKKAEALALGLKFANASQSEDNRALSILNAVELLGEAVSLQNAPMEQTIRFHLSWWTSQVHQLKGILSHTGTVSAVAFSPDGKTILTGSHDNTARLWDTASGKPLGSPLQHKKMVKAVAFSPDGKFVLTGSGDHTACLWDASSGQAIGPPMQHRESVRSVAFSPMGDILLTGSDDYTARLWDMKTGKQRGPVLQHFAGVVTVAFSPDGKTVLTGGHDKTARLWEAETGKPIGAPLQHQDTVFHLAFSRDSKTVVTGSADKSARLWEASTGKLIGTPLLHNGWVVAVAFSPDGKYVLTGSSDNTARFWDASSGEPVGQPMQYEGVLGAIAFSPDGKTVATASTNKTARLWETATGKPIGPPLQHQGTVEAVAFNRNGTALLTGSQDGTARLWETAMSKSIGQALETKAALGALAVSPDGRTVVTAIHDKTAQIWDVKTLKPIGPPLLHENKVAAVAISPDSKLALTGSWDKMARFWDTATGKPVGPTLHHQGAIAAVSFSPDGKIVVTGGHDKTARRWDTATGKELGPPLQHQDLVIAVTFSKDGESFWTRTHGKAVRLWETVSGAPLGAVIDYQRKAAGNAGGKLAGRAMVVFSDDGSIALTVGPDKTAQFWEANSGRPIGPAVSVHDRVSAVSVSHDGTIASVANFDKTVRLWKLATGTPIGAPLQHDGQVLAMSFSRDGRMLVTGSQDKSIRIWETATGKPLGRALQHEFPVRMLAFAPDGRTVVFGSQAHEDSLARLLPIPGHIKGDPDRLRQWAQVITGLELDGLGGTRGLDLVEWERRRGRLQVLGGPLDVD